MTRWPVALLLILCLALASCGGGDDGSDQSGGGGGGSGESLYKQAAFTKALSAVRSKVSADAEMLKIQVLPAQAEFQVKKGERAAGYRYDAKSGDLQKVDVKIIGGGSIEGLQYPFRIVDPGVTEKLDQAVRAKQGLHPTTMTLEKPPTGGKVRWSVTAEGNGRTGLVFTADPDGSNFQDIGSASDGSGGDAASKAKKQQQCILDAGNDAQKIQACLK